MNYHLAGGTSSVFVPPNDQPYKERRNTMEPVDPEDIPQVDEGDAFSMDIIGHAGLLVEMLEEKRKDGRLWAIAHTDAEKLLAWLRYAFDASLPDSREIAP